MRREYAQLILGKMQNILNDEPSTVPSFVSCIFEHCPLFTNLEAIEILNISTLLQFGFKMK